MRTWRRESVSSGTPWEPVYGYSRAVRVGPFIWVSGTTATGPDGEIVGPGDAYAQMRQTLENVRAALAKLGVGMDAVVRTRTFVTDVERFDEVARAHAEFFKESRPAASLVEVSGLVSPEMLVEVEVDAIVPE